MLSEDPVAVVLRIELLRRAAEIADALRSAYCGARYVRENDIVRAIVYRIGYGTLGSFGTLREIVAAVCQAVSLDNGLVSNRSVEMCCIAELAKIGVEPSQLPYSIRNAGM